MRERLTAERERLNLRLTEINEALGAAHVAPSTPMPGAFGAELPDRNRSVRRMSADARQKIAAAQRERWARQREASTAPTSKGSTPKAPGARHMSPEARRRIAAAMRQRWAERRAAQNKA